MGDFTFLENKITGKWVISSPRRASRPQEENGTEPMCPFCPGREGEEKEVYRLGSVRVIPNKFPFAPIHEIIIHSPDHHKNFDQLPLPQINLILQTYRRQYNEYSYKGQVYIFHNRGEKGGESLPHPHSQLAVVPFNVKMEIPPLNSVIASDQRKRGNLPDLEDPHVESLDSPHDDNKKIATSSSSMGTPRNDMVVETPQFSLFCPQTSQWPDEVWIAPKARNKTFGETTDKDLLDLSQILQRLIQIMCIRHDNNFPFNFYIYPGNDWYIRVIPRLKTLGGFELGTGVYVNTQDPKETMTFIKEHFDNSDVKNIKKDHLAGYSFHS